jgi:hypothetical protein
LAKGCELLPASGFLIGNGGLQEFVLPDFVRSISGEIAAVLAFLVTGQSIMIWFGAMPLGWTEQKSNGCLCCCMGIPGNILETFSKNYPSKQIAELWKVNSCQMMSIR